jgi:hypothetical protein
MGNTSSLSTEHGVSNDPYWRAKSDHLDKGCFKDHPTQHAIAHAAYHSGVGALKWLQRNNRGASVEFSRAGQQLESAWDESKNMLLDYLWLCIQEERPNQGNSLRCWPGVGLRFDLRGF